MFFLKMMSFRKIALSLNYLSSEVRSNFRVFYMVKGFLGQKYMSEEGQFHGIAWRKKVSWTKSLKGVG